MRKPKTVQEVVQEELDETTGIDWDRCEEKFRQAYIAKSVKRVMRFVRRDRRVL